MRFPFEIIEKPTTQVAGLPASIRVRLENDVTLVITVVDVENGQTYTYIRKGDVVARVSTSDQDQDTDQDQDQDQELAGTGTEQPLCAFKIPAGKLSHIFSSRFAMYVNRYSNKSIAELIAGPAKKQIDSSNLDVDLSF